MNEIDVEPVLPTYARTLSRLLTVMAVMYDKTMMIVVMMAKRNSFISSGLERIGILPADGWRRLLRLGLPLEGVSSDDRLRPAGRHLLTASTDARHG